MLPSVASSGTVERRPRLRPLVIVNPAAGRGGRNAGLERVLADLPGIQIRVTKAPGEATQLAASAARAGYDPLLLAGGDGLLHEVANGLLPLPTRPRIGLFPTGTGNDFARCLGIPRQLESALKVIRGGCERRVDAVRFRVAGDASSDSKDRESYMINVAATGLAGRVARRATTQSKSRWGARAYRRAAAAELLRLKPMPTELDADGEMIQLSTYAVVVANGGFVGGGIPILPEVRPDDGFLNILAVPAHRITAAAALLPRVLFALHGGRRGLVIRRARRIRLRATGSLWLNVDGENLDGAVAEFELLPEALRLLVPAPD